MQMTLTFLRHLSSIPYRPTSSKSPTTPTSSLRTTVESRYKVYILYMYCRLPPEGRLQFKHPKCAVGRYKILFKSVSSFKPKFKNATKQPLFWKKEQKFTTRFEPSCFAALASITRNMQTNQKLLLLYRFQKNWKRYLTRKLVESVRKQGWTALALQRSSRPPTSDYLY